MERVFEGGWSRGLGWEALTNRDLSSSIYAHGLTGIQAGQPILLLATLALWGRFLWMGGYSQYRRL
ncbi:hypothetical protein M434DRAFT_273873 [Hypoxylon sp. CO27-5]|nr:hypothetical protein M434DRAFT_273873 [Hypoxylon sp. CO27-5]